MTSPDMKMFTHEDRAQRVKTVSWLRASRIKNSRSYLRIGKLEIIGKKFLLTDGAGYIGSHEYKVLKQLGFIPVTFDNMIDAYIFNLQ